MLFASATERLYDLTVGIIAVAGDRHERPVTPRGHGAVAHRKLLVLAVLNHIGVDLATPERIPWCHPLGDRSTAKRLIMNDFEKKSMRV